MIYERNETWRYDEEIEINFRVGVGERKVLNDDSINLNSVEYIFLALAFESYDYTPNSTK